MCKDTLITALKNDRRIEAIKAVRDIASEGLEYATNGLVKRIGLREAKDIVDAVFEAYGKPADISQPVPYSSDEMHEPEYIVSVRDDFEEYSHIFGGEQQAMEYAEGRYKSHVTVGKVIAKTVAVTSYHLRRVAS